MAWLSGAMWVLVYVCVGVLFVGVFVSLCFMVRCVSGFRGGFDRRLGFGVAATMTTLH